MEDDQNLNSSDMNNGNGFDLMKTDSQIQNDNIIERRESHNIKRKIFNNIKR